MASPPPDLLSTTTSSSSSSSSDENTSTITSSSSLVIKPVATLLSPNSGPISSLSLASTDLLISSSDHHLLLFHNLLPLPATTTPAISSSIKTMATAGNLLVTAHQDSRIRLWRLVSSSSSAFKLAATLPTKSDVLSNLLFKAGNAYVQTRRHHRKLWIEHADTISALAVADDNRTLYSASWDKSIKVWSLRDLRCIESIKAHDDAVNALVACKGVLYSASADGKIKMWARSSTSKKHSLKGCLNDNDHNKKGSSSSVSWNALVVSDNKNGGGLVVYGGGSDGRVVGWEVEEEEGNITSVRVVCEMRVAVLCLCAVGEYMCVGAGDGSVGVWKMSGGGGRRLWKGGHEGPVKCLEAAREGDHGGEGFVLYSGGMDGSVKVWWVCASAT